MNDFPNNKTIAHELGHGAFTLEHPFVEFKGQIKEGHTCNLMDYHSCEPVLNKYQWSLIQDPKSVWFTSMMSKEESEYSGSVKPQLGKTRKYNIGEITENKSKNKNDQCEKFKELNKDMPYKYVSRYEYEKIKFFIVLSDNENTHTFEGISYNEHYNFLKTKLTNYTTHNIIYLSLKGIDFIGFKEDAELLEYLKYRHDDYIKHAGTKAFLPVIINELFTDMRLHYNSKDIIFPTNCLAYTLPGRKEAEFVEITTESKLDDTKKISCKLNNVEVENITLTVLGDNGKQTFTDFIKNEQVYSFDFPSSRNEKITYNIEVTQAFDKQNTYEGVLPNFQGSDRLITQKGNVEIEEIKESGYSYEWFNEDGALIESKDSKITANISKSTNFKIKRTKDIVTDIAYLKVELNENFNYNIWAKDLTPPPESGNRIAYQGETLEIVRDGDDPSAKVIIKEIQDENFLDNELIKWEGNDNEKDKFKNKKEYLFVSKDKKQNNKIEATAVNLTKQVKIKVFDTEMKKIDISEVEDESIKTFRDICSTLEQVKSILEDDLVKTIFGELEIKFECANETKLEESNYEKLNSPNVVRDIVGEMELGLNFDMGEIDPKPIIFGMVSVWGDLKLEVGCKLKLDTRKRMSKKQKVDVVGGYGKGEINVSVGKKIEYLGVEASGNLSITPKISIVKSSNQKFYIDLILEIPESEIIGIVNSPFSEPIKEDFYTIKGVSKIYELIQKQ